MIWLLFIFTLTWTLSWLGFAGWWSLLFSVIIWICVKLEASFGFWLFLEALMSFIYLFRYVTNSTEGCSACEGCPCGSGTPCSPCNVTGGCQKRVELPKQEKPCKQEEVFAQRLKREKREFKAIIFFWVVLFIWRLYIFLNQ